jgi:hypothetical protein
MKIAYFTLVTGIISLFVALIAYPYPILVSEPGYYRDPQGFLFFTSENIDSNREGSVNIIIENLTWQERRAFAELWIEMPVSLKQPNGSAYFVLQVLYETSSVNVRINDWSVEHFGGKTTTILYPANANSHDNSYILVEIPRKNVTGLMNFYVTFRWNNMLWRRTYTEYSLVIPFSAVYPSFIDSLGLPEETRNGNGILIFDYTSETKLSIERPEGVTFAETVPTADHYGLSYDKLWYTWDIKSKCNWTKYSSTAVIMDFEVDELVTTHERLFAISFLLFGIGIPMSLTSFFEILNVRRKLKRGISVKKKQTKDKNNL